MTDLTRKRGDTFADEFQIKSRKTGEVLDITGYSFTLTVDPAPEPANADNNLFAIAGVITDAPNGIVEFAPSATQSNLPKGTYYYDIELIDASGRKRTFVKARYIIEQDITK